MRLILTYHEVRDFSGDTEPGFYAIPPGALSRQLETLAAQGRTAMKMEELLSAAPLPEDKYILTFDDGTADHYDVVFPLLEKHRCVGSFFVPTAKLGQPGFLTREQLKQMAAAGHGIGSHSHEHKRLDILTEEEIRRQIAQSQEIIAEITGVKPVTFVPPGGYVNERVRRVAEDSGVRLMRTMRWGYNQKLDPMALETVPINRYTDDKKFIRLLEPRGQSPLYVGKEILKRMLPMRGYERLRATAFKLFGQSK